MHRACTLDPEVSSHNRHIEWIAKNRGIQISIVNVTNPSQIAVIL